MALWQYKGTTLQGKVEEGQVSANTKDDALFLVRRKRLTDIRIKKAPGQGFKIGTGIPSEDLARFTRQFAVMNASGLPISDCLNILEEQSENPSLRDVVRKVSASVSGGMNLSASLAMHPKVFDNLYVNMVAAGESGGVLEDVLVRLAEYQEKAERLKRKVKGAMTYPAIVAIVAVVVVIVLLALVVPKFAEIFTQTGGELPGPTQVVMNISGFLADNFLFIVIGGALLAFGFQYMMKIPKGRYAFDKLKLTIPKVSDLETKSSVARFSRTLGTLLSVGVPITDALEVTARTAGNVVIEEAIRNIRDSIAGWKLISDTMRDSGIFPGMVVQMVAVGERTGKLGEMLNRVADFYDEEVDAAVEALTAMIEPLVIVVLGVVIGGILIAMYLPMFSMTDNI
ncbi:MAG: type II secretion system F family protein [Fibrobacter sp.]|nr:type II secretion system F family protein [Fibrobacter sp.]